MQSLFSMLLSATLASASDLPPLQGDWIEPLYGPQGERVGMLVVPLGARTPRPLVISVHGAAGRPDWMCGATHDVLGPYPFVVCPHPSSATETMESWSDPIQLRRAVDRAVAAATSKFAAYISQDDAVYIGHSQGAMLAPAALAQPGTLHFPNLILYEGVPSNPGLATLQLAKAGTKRALIVSGQHGWAPGHARLAKDLERNGVVASHVHVESGHFFNAESISLMRRNLWWLLGTANAWRGDGAVMTTAMP